MYSTYTTQKSSLTSDDVAGIQAIYGARPQASPNNSFSTATNLNGQIDPNSLTARVTGLDISKTCEVDYYSFTAPSGSSSTLNVNVQSSGLSLLAPTLTIYAADQSTVLGSASYSGTLGATLSVTVSGIKPGQVFYAKVSGANTTAFGTGAYALTLNFGTGSSPTVTPPNTQTAASGSPSTSGGYANGAFVPSNFLTNAVIDTAAVVTTILPEIPGHFWTDDDVHSDRFAAGAAATTGPSFLPAHATAFALSTAPTGTSPGTPASTVVSAFLGTQVPQGVASATATGTGSHVLLPVAGFLGLTGSHVSVKQQSAATGGGEVSAEAEQALTVSEGQDPSGMPIELPCSSGIQSAVGPAQIATATAWAALTAPSSLHLLREQPEPLSQPMPESNLLSGTVSSTDTGVSSGWSTSFGNGMPLYLAAGAAALLGLGGGDSRGFEERRRRGASGKPNWSERRQKMRYPCWLHSSCWQLGRPPIERCDSVAQDVSTGGVKLVMRRPFDEGTFLIAELEGSGGGCQRCVVARVVHVLETAPGVWELGCVFDRAVEEDAIHDLLLGGLRERPAALLQEL
jgi:hypothetical protein